MGNDDDQHANDCVGIDKAQENVNNGVIADEALQKDRIDVDVVSQAQQQQQQNANVDGDDTKEQDSSVENKPAVDISSSFDLGEFDIAALTEAASRRAYAAAASSTPATNEEE